MVVHPQTLDRAATLISQLEGVETEAYVDPAGHTTICTGLTRYENGEPVRQGDICSERVCHEHTKSLIAKDCVPLLEKIPSWSRFGSRRQAALLSFAWNNGFAFYEQDDFKDIAELLKAGSINPSIYSQVGAEMLNYTQIKGRESPALTSRRLLEKEVWDREANCCLTLRNVVDTYLKKAPIDALALSDSGKIRFEEGEEISCSDIQEIPNSTHNWLALNPRGERWVIDWRDWEVVMEDIEHRSHESYEDWFNLNCFVGKYLTVGELLQYDLRRVPDQGSQEEKNLFLLAREFSAVREGWGGSIGVCGGFRPEPINREIGGDLDDPYSHGKALDIYPCGDEVSHLFNWLRHRWSGSLIDYSEKGYIRLDMSDIGVGPARFLGLR